MVNEKKNSLIQDKFITPEMILESASENAKTKLYEQSKNNRGWFQEDWHEFLQGPDPDYRRWGRAI